jgi:hypothetical protein
LGLVPDPLTAPERAGLAHMVTSRVRIGDITPDRFDCGFVFGLVLCHESTMAWIGLLCGRQLVCLEASRATRRPAHVA